MLLSFHLWGKIALLIAGKLQIGAALAGESCTNLSSAGVAPRNAQLRDHSRSGGTVKYQRTSLLTQNSNFDSFVQERSASQLSLLSVRRDI